MKFGRYLFDTLNNLFIGFDDSYIDLIIKLKQSQSSHNHNAIAEVLTDLNKHGESAKDFFHKFKHFIVKDGNLIFEPLNLQVIKKVEVKKTLTELFKDNESASKGIVSLYKYVCTKYINITREDVAEFLKHQASSQITTRQAHHVNKPIISLYSNSLWCVDLIDLDSYKAQNDGYRYIMNVIDAFSRKLWLAN